MDLGCRWLHPAGRKRGLAPLFLLFLVATLAPAAPPAFGQERAKPLPVPGGTYRRPLGHDPETLDPARISDIYGQSVAQQLFDGLVQFDQTLTVTPALAQFWKASRDGLTWTFILRKGVKFHDRREVTAEDVVYSLTRILDPKVKSVAADLFMHVKGAPEFRAGRARAVAGLVAVDRHTVRVELEEASVPFVSILAVNHAKILPKDVVEREGEAFGSRPIGTGPFKFVRWERGKEIVLEGNPDYFDGAPHLSRLVYRIFPGDLWDLMYEEFAKGHIEDSPIPMGKYRRIVEGREHVYVRRPMISLRFYGFNTRQRPLDDRRVRQAILYALNREAIIEEVLLGRFALARGILPPGIQGFNPNLRGYAFDPDKARELLAEAGYPGGRGLPPIAIWASVKLDQLLREQERMKADLEAVGIRAELKYLTDWPAYSRKLLEGQFPVFLYAWYADVPDPDNFLFKLFHSRSPRNFFGYVNPLVDELLERARRETDPMRRMDLHRQAEQLIVADAPVIPIMHHTYERVFQRYVRNLEVSGLGDPSFPLRKVWLEKPR
jgi:oligopeptide transport system substrate-binding protein